MAHPTSPNSPARYFQVIQLILLVYLCIFSHPASAEVVGNRKVVVGIYENPPKVFTSQAGKPTGIFVDIIEHIANVEGWELQYLSGTWAEGLDRLTKGQIDFMPDVAYSAERQHLFSFHRVPVLSSWSQVYAKKGSKIQSILDLNDKKVLVLEGSVQQERFSRFAGGFGLTVSLATTPDYKTMFEAMTRGEADAAITNRFYGLAHAKAAGLEDTAVVFDPSDLFFAAPLKADKELLDIVDLHLTSLKKDSESVYYRSLKQWLADEVKFQIPLWLKVSGFVGIGFLLASIVGSFILKHQVNLRTRELRIVNQEMEQRIIQRTAELAAAMEKAQAADKIKSAFLATMSHELRTPLNSIIGFTGIMLQGLAGPLNAEQQKQMGMVQNSSRHLLALINDVLDISKIEAGQLNLAITTFDLRQSIEKMVKVVSPLADQKGLAIELAIASDIGNINTDQRRLEQVILNLLSNAVKFTEQGHIHVSCRGEGDTYVLSFADTGIGMQAEELINIFQPFHQIDTGLARKREGTGLGLSICKKIVELMGGSIDVDSTWEKGSIFTIRIPRQLGDLS
ncbi:MAG: ATP-binding protein [Desulforhopalus sp.]|nr:ATP-binding protein [Desulforhopalus sp.]